MLPSDFSYCNWSHNFPIFVEWIRIDSSDPRQTLKTTGMAQKLLSGKGIATANSGKAVPKAVAQEMGERMPQ